VGDHIEVPLAIDDMDVVATEVVNGALEVRVRSTFPAARRHCGSTAVIGHGRNERRVRDRSCGQPMVLVWHQRRLLCRDCGRTGRELHPAVEGRRSITVRFRRQLFDEACERPFSEVASHHRVSAYRVVEAFDAYSRVETTTVGRPRVLAMDESSFKKRFVFQTVLFDPIAGRGLAVADGRDQRAAEELLFGLPRRVRRRVETVVIDCHVPFQKAIKTAMPQARIVVDKFHVLAAIDRAANNVRVRLGHQKNYRGRDGGTARQHNPRNDPPRLPSSVGVRETTLDTRRRRTRPPLRTVRRSARDRRRLVAQRSLRRHLRSPRPGRSRATSRAVGTPRRHRRHQRDRRLLAQPAAAGAKRSSPTSTTARPTVTPKASPTRSKS
jgi:transposase